MLGTIVNAGCIVVGSCIGATISKHIRAQYQKIMMDALGLASFCLGVSTFTSSISKSDVPILFIIALVIGGLIGHTTKLNARFQRLIEKAGSTSTLAKGIVTTSLLYCIGTLSIVGPIISATTGDNTFLFTNAAIDIFCSAIFAASYGIGIAWGAAVLFIWQGTIWTITYALGNIIPEALITELTITGGALLVFVGISILELRKDIHTLTYLPSLIIPIIYYIIKALL